ncbi:MAG: YlbF family regulator [Salinigranum sp.]
MSVETKSLEDLGRELGDAIAETPEYREFERTRTAVQDDDEAQELIAEFSQLRDELLTAQQMGSVSQEEYQKVQQAQQELHELPVMAEYLEAQAELQARLSSINDAISEPLAVDFGGEAGGCCHD